MTNDLGLLSTLHSEPLGLLPPPEEDISTYVSPEISELGAVESRRGEQGELREEPTEDYPQGEYISDVELPTARPLVKLRGNIRRMIPGSRGLFDLDETKDLYRQSQALFGDRVSGVELMILIVAYGGAMLTTWLILTQAGGAVPSHVINVPGMSIFPGVGL